MGKHCKTSKGRDEDKFGANAEAGLFQNNRRITNVPKLAETFLVKGNRISDSRKFQEPTKIIQRALQSIKHSHMPKLNADLDQFHAPQNHTKEENDATNPAFAEPDDSQRPLSPEPISWLPPANETVAAPPPECGAESWMGEDQGGGSGSRCSYVENP